ncbi:MAG: sorbitol dehydrogenase, partial [Bacteroidetes bacterium]
MKAFYITEPGKTEIKKIKEPEPQSDEILLKIKKVGLCGSDLNTFRGKNPLVSFPRIPCHEVAGEVIAIGKDVPAYIKTGMTTTVSPYTNCGKCPACRNKRPNACQFNQTLGVQRDGALKEYICVPWEKIYFSAKLSEEELTLVEPFSVGFHAVERGEITQKDTVAVLGCGSIGVGVIAAAVQKKAKVIAVDIDDNKLNLVKKIMPEVTTINSRLQNLHKILSDITNAGPDVIIEAIGLPITFRVAVEEVAFTGRVVYIGYAKDPTTYETKM